MSLSSVLAGEAGTGLEIAIKRSVESIDNLKFFCVTTL